MATKALRDLLPRGGLAVQEVPARGPAVLATRRGSRAAPRLAPGRVPAIDTHREGGPRLCVIVCLSVWGPSF